MAPTPQQRQSRKAQQASGAKTKARVDRYLKGTEPQLRQPTKAVLLFKGIHCSDGLGRLLQELRAVAAPHAKLLSKKNQFVAWDQDGQQSIEFLATKNDCALFGMAHHNKKRPNHLTIGRTFDHQILDLAELAVLRFKSMQDYGGAVPKKRIGSKPMLLFVGDIWAQDESYVNLQNLLVDFYRGEIVEKLILSGLDHLIVFTAAPCPALPAGSAPLIHQRTYFCKLKKNPAGGDRAAPLAYLMPCGPDLDFQLRRTQWAEPDLYKAARRQPAALRAKKAKNQTTNVFGETIGRLHIARQNVEQMQGKKAKALRKAEKLEREEDREAIEHELGREKQELDSSFQQTFGFSADETKPKARRRG